MPDSAAHRPPWSIDLTEMPDPLSGGKTTILIDEGVLRHLHAEHASQPFERPSWRDFLGLQMLERYDRWITAPSNDPTFPDEIAALLRGQMEEVLPCRVVLYDQVDTGGAYLHLTCEVVTRSGLIVVLRGTDRGYGLMTAFFAFEADREPPHRRGLEAARSRVALYAGHLLVEGRKRVVHPEPADEFPSQDPVGSRTNVRFITPRMWGFREVQIEGERFLEYKSPLPLPAPPAGPSSILKKPKPSTE
jgi:hypothetical protein